MVLSYGQHLSWASIKADVSQGIHPRTTMSFPVY